MDGLGQNETTTYQGGHMIKNWIGVVAGGAGKGKTHMALSACQHARVFCADTEGRAEWIKDRRFQEKSDNIDIFYAKNWQGFKEVGKAIREWRQDNKTARPSPLLVIDSGTDFRDYAEAFVVDHRKPQHKFHKSQWGLIGKEMKNYLHALRDKLNCNVLLTSQVREKYLNDKPTGIIEPRIYQRVIHEADFVMWYNEDQRQWEVTKNVWANPHEIWTWGVDPRKASLYPIVRDLMEQNLVENTKNLKPNDCGFAFIP